MPAMPNWWMPPAIGGSITAPPNQSLGTPKSNNPIPQNWMQVISDLMNKPPVPTPAAGSPTQPPTSKTTNTGVQDALQKIIGRFGGGAATAQPTQMPSWWNTGRSVYPWGRGSTF